MPNNLTAASMPAPQSPADAPQPDPAAVAPPQAPAAPTPDAGPPGTDPAAAAPPTLDSAGIDPEKLQDAIHKTAVMDHALHQLLDQSTGGKIDRGALIRLVVKIVSDRIMAPAAAAQYLADCPEDPGAIREWVQRHADEGAGLLAQMVTAQHGSEATPPTAPAGGGMPMPGPPTLQ